MSRWISVVRPSTFVPRSRRLRGLVLPGSMLYSAVSQPRPLPFIQPGTSGSTDARLSPVVRPAEIKTGPGDVHVCGS